MRPKVISSDEAKKKLKGYDPGKAELFHVESAKMADKEFAESLRDPLVKNVILMSGGSASGKTEFVSGYLSDFQGIIFDSTLPTIEGAKIKINKTLRANKIPQIYAVFPDDLGRAFVAFLNRDRRFSVEHFYRTHSSSRKTLHWIAVNYPQVEIKVFESIYLVRGDMSFKEYKFTNHMHLIEFLKKSQYTENEIIKIIKKT